MTAPNHAISCRASIVRNQGRLIACCEIEHFFSSGLSVPELFAQLRPQLVASIEDAAARDQHDGDTARAPSAGMDVDSIDPEITLWVRSPAAAMSDPNECFRRLEVIVTRFAAEKRDSLPLLGAHPS